MIYIYEYYSWESSAYVFFLFISVFGMYSIIIYTFISKFL